MMEGAVRFSMAFTEVFGGIFLLKASSLCGLICTSMSLRLLRFLPSIPF